MTTRHFVFQRQSLHLYTVIDENYKCKIFEEEYMLDRVTKTHQGQNARQACVISNGKF